MLSLCRNIHFSTVFVIPFNNVQLEGIRPVNHPRKPAILLHPWNTPDKLTTNGQNTRKFMSQFR